MPDVSAPPRSSRRQRRARRRRRRAASLAAVALLALALGVGTATATQDQPVAVQLGIPLPLAAVPALLVLHSAPPPAPPAPASAPACRAAGPPEVRAHGTRHRRTVALTFDDGPWPSTPAILRILRREHVHATFFVIGRQVRDRPATMARLRREGHAVGDHTWSHADMAAASARDAANELDWTRNAIARRAGTRPCLFRAPYGSTNGRVVGAARRRGMITVGWDVDSRDYTRPGTKQIVRTVLGSVRPGSIVLLHDGGGDRGETIAALPKIIHTLKRRNYRLVTVPALLGLPSDGQAGRAVQAAAGRNAPLGGRTGAGDGEPLARAELPGSPPASG